MLFSVQLDRVFSRIRDHETITEKGQDVRTVLWQRRRGLTGGNPASEDQSEKVSFADGEYEMEADEMTAEALNINLGPTADEIEALIRQQKAAGQVYDQPYEEDEDNDLEEEEAEEEVDEDVDVDEEVDEDDEHMDDDAEEGEDDDEGVEDLMDFHDVDEEDVDEEDVDEEVVDEEDEEEDEEDVEEGDEGEGEEGEGEEIRALRMEVEQRQRQAPPVFPELPPVVINGRQTLLFSATGLQSNKVLHAKEKAQLKKYRLRGTVLGVATDFSLPTSLKQ